MLQLSHKNLEVWKRSIKLTMKIYQITEKFPNTEIYGLVSQLRRAAVSVPSNIAEGASRTSAKDKVRFFEIARSSLVEIDTQLEIAIQLGYSAEDDLHDVEVIINETFAMLSSLMQSRTRKRR